MSILDQLVEKRSTAMAALEALVTPIIAETRAMTTEEDAKRTELRGVLDMLDTEIDGKMADEARSATIASTRAAAGLNAPAVSVTNEPSVYGIGSPNSYFGDLWRSKSNTNPDHDGAVSRLAEHRAQVDGILSSDPSSKQAKSYRSWIAGTARVPESRAITTSTVGGLVVPQFLVQDALPYRLPGRTVADLCNKSIPLTEQGLVINLPVGTAAAGVQVQGSENSAGSEVDPTIANKSANVATVFGNVNASRQSIERGYQTDVFIADALGRAMNQAIDAYVIAQIMAVATGQTWNGSFTVKELFSQLGLAKATIKTAAGVVAYPTAEITDPTFAEFVLGQSDSNGRPLFITESVAFNPFGVGAMATTPEGFTGFNVNGVNLYEDANVPGGAAGATPTSHNLIVGDLSMVYLMEAAANYNVFEQSPNSQSLEILFQTYEYLAVLPAYPGGLVNISGSAMLPSQVTF